MENNTNVNAGTENTSVTETQETQVNEPKTYTEEEVRAMLQSEADRRVNSALKKQQRQYEKQMAEAEKLRGMDETQRKEYEFDQKVQQLEQREKDFNLVQNKLEATKVLSNRGLPVEFVEYVVAEDAETMMDNILIFEKAFKAAVSDEVSKRISSNTPKSGSVKQTGLSKEAFHKMSLAQQAEVYRTNPQLYKELTH